MSSSAASYDITIDRGSDWSKVLTLRDLSGTAVPITNIFTTAISIAGTTSPSVTAASLTYVSTDLWTSNGNATAPGSGTWIRVRRASDAWEITKWVNGVQVTGYWTSATNPNHPAWVESWAAASGATGSPEVDSTGMFFEGSISLHENGPDVIPFSFDTVGDGTAGQVEISLTRSYSRALASSGAYRYDWFVYRGRERSRLVAGRVTARGSSTGISTGIPVPAFGSSPSVSWGSITGTLSNQTDLQDALDAISGGGANSVTSATTSDGTADLSISNVSTATGSVSGILTAPTAATTTSTTQVATTAFVQQELASGVAVAKNLEFLARNQSGATITKGSIVYINGATGNKPLITLAQANSDENSAQTIGFAKTDIADNGTGFVIVRGELENVNTNGLGEGTQLYLSPSVAGNWITAKPSAPEHLVYVGIVVRDHPTQGIILVAIQNGYELNEIHDVAISSPAAGQVIKRNAGNTLWINSAIVSADVSDATNAATPSTLVLRDVDGGASFNAVNATYLDVSGVFQVSEFGPVTFGSSSELTFNAVTYAYGAGAAAAHRTALGATATGVSLFMAATPAAARTTLGMRTFVKPTDESRSSNSTYTLDTHLKDIPMEAGKSYKIEFYVSAYVPGLPNNEGGKVRLLLPLSSRATVPNMNGAVFVQNWGNASGVAVSTSTTGAPAGMRYFLLQAAAGHNQNRAIVGVAYTDVLASAGNLSLEWAQNTSGVNATILLAGSTLTVTEL